MDLQRHASIEIPNLLFDILEKNDTHKLTISELKEVYGNKYNKGMDVFMTKLIDMEIGFLTSTPELFPELSKDYYTPFNLHTAIICIDKESNYNLKKLVNVLIKEGCKSVQFRVFSVVDYHYFLNCLRLFTGSRVKVVEVIFDYHYQIEEFLAEFENLDPRYFIYILASEKTPKDINRRISKKIDFRIGKLDEAQEEVVSSEYFIVNTMFYIESLKHNTGLNRKVSVDIEGNVKNHISHSHSFGNLNSTSLYDILSLASFKEKWVISNDDIYKCKDCQYRYMCINNSDLHIIDGEYHRLATCGFNPYRNEWE